VEEVQLEDILEEVEEVQLEDILVELLEALPVDILEVLEVPLEVILEELEEVQLEDILEAREDQVVDILVELVALPEGTLEGLEDPQEDTLEAAVVVEQLEGILEEMLNKEEATPEVEQSAEATRKESLSFPHKNTPTMFFFIYIALSLPVRV